MPNRQAHAVWEGDLSQGQGRMKLGSGAYEGAFSFKTRMENEPGTNPEELIGAALAGCFSMALSGALGKAGASGTRVQTDAVVHFEQGDGGWRITAIDLKTEIRASGVDEAQVRAIADTTKSQCPVAKALTGTEIRLDARVV
jgi:lipoyl-dependent peroxiredoxin